MPLIVLATSSLYCPLNEVKHFFDIGQFLCSKYSSYVYCSTISTDGKCEGVRDFLIINV